MQKLWKIDQIASHLARKIGRYLEDESDAEDIIEMLIDGTAQDMNLTNSAITATMNTYEIDEDLAIHMCATRVFKHTEWDLLIDDGYEAISLVHWETLKRTPEEEEWV